MRETNRFALLFLTAALALAAASACAGLPPSVAGEPLPSLAPMLERVTPAVVNVATRSRVRVRSPLLSDPFFQRFFGLEDQVREKESQSLGSGVIVDAENGYVLTNVHVIEDADTITVTLEDGRELTARVVGADPDSDIAVLGIPPGGLTAIPLGDSSRLRVGDFVVAIGSPFGLGQTVTSGIVSGLGRTGLGIEGYEDFIQTDASINPGNSGGALVNLRGELVGLNTAILAPSGGNIGIGFAIPVHMAKGVMRQLIDYGEVRRGQLGVQVQDLTPELARAFGLDVGRGAVIARVQPSSAAARAGLQPGDVVLRADGKPVRNASDLRNRVGLVRVGEAVTLEVLREGRRRTLTARIAEPEVHRLRGERLSPHLAGATLGEMTASELGYASDEPVVVVLEVERGTPAARAGLARGDVLTSVNRVVLDTLQDLAAAVERDPDALLINVQRGDEAYFVLLR